MRLVDETCIGALERIPVGEGREVDLGGLLVAVFRTRSGSVHALEARCPHRGGPLADGLVDSTSVVCPLHGWRFRLQDGAALVGDSPTRSFAVREGDDGNIYVRCPAPASDGLGPAESPD
ncbi:MAG: Rieske 2Fe-2S domain-containing protein [Actinomycetota bacterium]|nr:Rieske 2Fe-2S domain-containing protein [Actinomycetota bacterium]